jgi:hypothetical protein
MLPTVDPITRIWSLLIVGFFALFFGVSLAYVFAPYLLA